MEEDDIILMLAENPIIFYSPIVLRPKVGSEPLINSLYEKQLSNRLKNGPTADAPARFSVKRTGDEINISWLDIADDESGYVIEISYDGINFEELIEVAADETSYNFPISQLINETAYFRMYANSSTTCSSAYTHTAFFDSTISSSKNKEATRLEFFPNPFAEFLEIKIDNKSISNIQIFSLDGKKVQSDFSNNEVV